MSAAASPRARVLRATIISSIVIYAIIVGINFDPEVRAKSVEAFGARPFGLPVTAVVVAVETLLFIPFPWIFWHLAKVLVQSVEDRGTKVPAVGLWRVLAEVFRARRHPHLRRSVVVVVGGLLYFVLICGSWIAYAAMKGI